MGFPFYISNSNPEAIVYCTVTVFFNSSWLPVIPFPFPALDRNGFIAIRDFFSVPSDPEIGLLFS